MSTFVQPYLCLAFSDWMQITVPTGKRSDKSRGMTLVTCMQELQTSRCGNQWHPRVQHSVRNSASHLSGSVCSVFEYSSSSPAWLDDSVQGWDNILGRHGFMSIMGWQCHVLEGASTSHCTGYGPNRSYEHINSDAANSACLFRCDDVPMKTIASADAIAFDAVS
jgi:hypothetical protein